MAKRDTKTSVNIVPDAYVRAFRAIFWLSFAMAGLYYEFFCALISALLVLWLILLGRKMNFSWYRSLPLIAVGLCAPGYLLSSLWGADPGLGLFGICKFLPVPLFMVGLMQFSKEQRIRFLDDLPLIGALMVPLSFILQLIPGLATYFNVAGRMSGLFQYPNTFACFLLIGLEIVILQDKLKWWLKLLVEAALIFGLLQAGSRTIFLLAIAALVICLVLRIRNQDRQAPAAAVLPTLAKTLLPALAVGGGLALLWSRLGSTASIEHMLDITPGASTFLGRLLYGKDALPVILKHPFGMGYLGYYVSQGTFQTGVYSVRWVHNDLLQLLLDVGWIPAICLTAAIIRTIFSKNISVLQRTVLLTLCAHSMVDFDLQFTAMYFVLLICLDWEDGTRAKKASFKPGRIGALLACAAVLGSLYLGIASGLTVLGKHQTAAAWYPANTLSQIELLPTIGDTAALDSLAGKILERDPYIALAWDARAQSAFSEGDFTVVITCKRKAIECNPYDIQEYIDYFEKLQVGVNLYEKAGDADSAAFCMEEILHIQTMIDETLAKTDPLAWKIADQPELNMPAEYAAYCRE